MKIVLDANVFIAAFLAKGLASEILKLGEKGKIKIFASDEILKEVEDKLVNKAKLDALYVRKLINHTEISVSKVRPTKKLSVVKIDPEDNKIIECAVEAGANLIVTMDKHLLKMKSYERIGIVHPKTLTWIIPKFFEN